MLSCLWTHSVTLVLTFFRNNFNVEMKKNYMANIGIFCLRYDWLSAVSKTLLYSLLKASSSSSFYHQSVQYHGLLILSKWSLIPVSTPTVVLHQTHERSLVTLATNHITSNSHLCLVSAQYKTFIKMFYSQIPRHCTFLVSLLVLWKALGIFHKLFLLSLLNDKFFSVLFPWGCHLCLGLEFSSL